MYDCSFWFKSQSSQYHTNVSVSMQGCGLVYTNLWENADWQWNVRILLNLGICLVLEPNALVSESSIWILEVFHFLCSTREGAVHKIIPPWRIPVHHFYWAFSYCRCTLSLNTRTADIYIYFFTERVVQAKIIKHMKKSNTWFHFISKWCIVKKQKHNKNKTFCLYLTLRNQNTYWNTYTILGKKDSVSQKQTW